MLNEYENLSCFSAYNDIRYWDHSVEFKIIV